MASLLRQIVASPRSRHPEAGLDLCYVTPFIIATSGPSSTYPQLAYRNPLDQLVKWLDYKHKDNWCIWEFRAEGTGYPDESVYGRIKHYPWPDHHPPPFGVVPLVMGGMRQWLRAGEDGKEGKAHEDNKRVVVVHCKAGKGRSGTMACSYLISECGWKPAEALARFTERRMKPGFGQGVSIPSQLRWVGYVDRWTNSGKIYVERQVEIMEVHVWGLRDGVKVQVEGFVDDGKTIKLFHVFTKKERIVVEGTTPGGLKTLIFDMAGFNEGKIKMSKSSDRLSQANGIQRMGSKSSNSNASEKTGSETGGGAVIFKPSKRVILPTSDINLDFERRNKASIGWTMVTAVAHVWFNAYFEGNGPEQNGRPDDSGVFEIDWDKMDGIKGSSRKGARAFDRLAVIWKVYDPEPGQGRKEEIIHEPSIYSPVPEMRPANWQGCNETSPGLVKDLGLRTESPASAEVSKANSVKSQKANIEDDDSMEGVRPSGPAGEEDIDVVMGDLPQPKSNGSEPSLAGVNSGLDTASSTTPQRGISEPAASSSIDGNANPSNTGGVVSPICTAELPNGVPENELRDVIKRNIGRLQSTKKTIDS